MWRNKLGSEAWGKRRVARLSVIRISVRFWRKRRIVWFQRMRNIAKFGGGKFTRFGGTR
jgi:hypothetical protein